jgi:N-succinyldiaminopimelate aminotransferase
MNCEIKTSQVLVSAGATGGLGAALGAILTPGDEVMILAPFWPLIAGIVRTFRGQPVAVPVLGEGFGVDEFVAQLDAFRTNRTVAVYLNTPNNPTGESLPKSWMEALAHWARTHGLWILADEVYDLYVYEGQHTYK